MPAAQPLSQPASPPFVVARTFNAPRALVWQAFTEAERLKAWWGPKGFPVASGQIDLRPGGCYHYAMQVPDGSLMWAKCVYREIAAPERIVFINCFCSESGVLARNPMVPGWPMEVLSVFSFAEQDGRTAFTLEWTPAQRHQGRMRVVRQLPRRHGDRLGGDLRAARCVSGGGAGGGRGTGGGGVTCRAGGALLVSPFETATLRRRGQSQIMPVTHKEPARPKRPRAKAARRPERSPKRLGAPRPHNRADTCFRRRPSAATGSSDAGLSSPAAAASMLRI